MKSAAKYAIFLGVASILCSCSLIFADPDETALPPSDSVLACRSYAQTANSVAEECGVSLREFRCQDREGERCEGRANYYRCLEDNIECIGGEIRHSDADCNLECGPSNAQICEDIFADPSTPQPIQTLCFSLQEQLCDAAGVFDCLDYLGRNDADALRLCSTQSDCTGVETLARCLEFSERPDVRACNEQGDLCAGLARCNDPNIFDCIDETFTCQNGEPNLSPECVSSVDRCFNFQANLDVSTDACELFMRGAEQCTGRRASPSSCDNLRFLAGGCEGMADFFGCLNETSLCTEEGWLSFPAYCSEQGECSRETRGLASCISAQQRIQALPCAENAWLTLDQCLGEIRDRSAPARNACLQDRPRCEGSQLSFECYDAGFEGEGEGEEFP